MYTLETILIIFAISVWSIVVYEIMVFQQVFWRYYGSTHPKKVA